MWLPGSRNGKTMSFHATSPSQLAVSPPLTTSWEAELEALQTGRALPQSCCAGPCLREKRARPRAPPKV